MSTITDLIREQSAAVADRAALVRIDGVALAAYARGLPLDKAIAPALDGASHYLADEAGTVAFFVTLDAINFGSGYFPRLRKRPGMSGYFTVASSLKDEFARSGPISADRLAGLGAADCAAIFGQSRSEPEVMELMGLFARALNDLGRLLLATYGGRFTNLVAAADHSSERLIGLLAEMPFFMDVQHYGDLEVPFYKRAQLTAADLSLALGGRGLGAFHDLDRLTIFADNLVPHVLRIDGVLKYDSELAARIDREDLIPAGSPEEVEIRAGAVHAVERMVQVLRQAGRPVTAAGLDYLLWNRGQEKHYKTIKPRHRARTVYY